MFRREWLTPEQRDERGHRWVRRYVIGCLVFVAFALAVMGWAVSARASLIQRHALTATHKVQRWESTSRGHNVYVGVYVAGASVKQQWDSGCEASYAKGPLFVRLRVKDCGKPGLHPYVLWFVSVGQPVRFLVRLET